MRIIVTGSCGLVGFNTCRYLSGKGHDIFAIDNLERSDLLGHEVSPARKYYNETELSKLGIHNIRWDISDERTWDRIKEADAIIHLAGQCGVPTSIANPKRDFEINTVGTFLGLECARRTGAKFILASTNKVYPIHEGWHLEDKRWRWTYDSWHKYGIPITFSSAGIKSRTPYGASKYAADILVQEYGKTYGLQTACFRMSCIYGENQMGFAEQGWAAHFVIATLKDQPIQIFGDGYQVRDMLWVEDLIKAYESFINKDTGPAVYNIGGGPDFTLSLNECLDIIEKVTGKRSQVTYHDWRPADQRVYTSDILPTQLDLDWRPTIAPLEGLERLVKWATPILDIF